MLLCLTDRIKAQQDNVWALEECIDYALYQNILVRKGELILKDMSYTPVRQRPRDCRQPAPQFR